MDEAEGGEGERGGAGQDCPAHESLPGKEGGEITVDSERLRSEQLTEKERSAINRCLKEPRSLGAGSGRAAT